MACPRIWHRRGEQFSPALKRWVKWQHSTSPGGTAQVLTTLACLATGGALKQTWVLLIQRIESLDTRFRIGANAHGVDANDRIFFRAEPTNARLIDRERHAYDCVAHVDASRHGTGACAERVAALAAARGVTVVGEHRVDQACRR